MTATPAFETQIIDTDRQRELRRQYCDQLRAQFSQQYRYAAGPRGCTIEARRIEPGVELGSGNIPPGVCLNANDDVLIATLHVTPTESVKATRMVAKGEKVTTEHVTLTRDKLVHLVNVGRVMARLTTGEIIAEPID